MKKNKLTKRDAVHCKTESEFKRLIKLFKLDPEFMDWSFYKNHTVLYPLVNQYGCINGYCSDNGFNVIESENIS